MPATIPADRVGPPAASTSVFPTLALGCTVGCLGFIGLAIVGGLALVRWATSPTPLPASRAFLTPDVSAYLEANLDRTNPGSEAFIDFVLEEVPKDDRRHMLNAAPASLVAFAVGDPARLGAVFSLTRYMNWLQIPMLLVRQVHDEEVVKYRDEVLLNQDATVAFVAGSMVLGSDLDALKFVIDRMQDGDGGPASAAVEELWSPLEPAPIRGVVVNDAGQLLQIIDLLHGWQLIGESTTDSPSRPVLQRVRTATLVARFGQPSPDAIGGDVRLSLPDASEADAEVVRALLKRLSEALVNERVSLVTTARVEEASLLIDFRLLVDRKAVRDRDWQVGPVKVE